MISIRGILDHANDDEQFDESQPMPPAALALMPEYRKLLGEMERLAMRAKKVGEKLEPMHSKVIEAIHEAVPAARQCNFRWSAENETFQLAKDKRPAPPDWVADVLKEEDEKHG